MRKSNVEKAREYGESFAVWMFSDFEDHPNFRGPNFTWENFPEMACRQAVTHMFLNIMAKTKRDEMEDACREACLQKCRELVKKHITSG